MHAAVIIPGKARRQLENLCRYVARPAVATERLSRLLDGRVLYRLRHPWRDGTSHMIFDPLDLLGKLAALVPRPRVNLVRYHGTLAPSSRWRSSIVPMPSSDDEETGSRKHAGCVVKKGQKDSQEKDDRVQKAGHSRNYSWAELLKRVFDFDILRCGTCGGRMRILCAINPPPAIKRILDCLGLPSRPPPSLRRCYGGQAISAAVLVDPFNF
jgi:hypothetical protein